MRARNRKRKRSKNESRSIQDNDNTLARASYESTAVSAFRMCECDGSHTMNDQQKLQGTEPRRILFGYRIRAHMHTHSHLHIHICISIYIVSVCSCGYANIQFGKHRNIEICFEYVCVTFPFILFENKICISKKNRIDIQISLIQMCEKHTHTDTMSSEYIAFVCFFCFHSIKLLRTTTTKQNCKNCSV